MNISRKEIRRYLGMRNAALNEETDALIEECVKLLEEAAVPRHVTVSWPLTWEEGYPCIEGNRIDSRDLARNLHDCTEIVIMACTLGADVDRLIQKYSVLSMSKAAVLQACAAAMIEAVCDEVNETVCAEARRDGLYARPRYSPGYGDCSLETQKLIFSLINLPKQIGLTLNSSLLMTPFKSVTAFIGLSPAETGTEKNRCALCAMGEDCIYSDTKEVSP